MRFDPVDYRWVCRERRRTGHAEAWGDAV